MNTDEKTCVHGMQTARRPSSARSEKTKKKLDHPTVPTHENNKVHIECGACRQLSKGPTLLRDHRPTSAFEDTICTPAGL